MTATTPTAHWPVPSLLRSLSRAAWGEIGGADAQGVRSTLRGLADLLPDKAGQGLATVAQIADSAGLSERWTRTRLQLLEDAGVITWTRGGVINGKPMPSFFRIVKTALVELIDAARGVADRIRADRAARTKARVERLRWAFNQRSRRSVHPELSTSPDTYGRDHVRPARADHPRGGPPMQVCEHGGDAGRLKSGLARCPMCRRVEKRATDAAKAAQNRPDYAMAAAGDDTLWED